MSATNLPARIEDHSNLYDAATGALVGFMDALGREVLIADLITNDVAPIEISGAYTLSAANERGTLIAADGTVITIPDGLALKYGTIVRCPGTGDVTVSPGSSAVILNGVASTTITRTRGTSPNGFAITPNPEANSWGVSNGAVAGSFGALAGDPADNAALAAALDAKANVGDVPGVLLRSGPRLGVAQGSAQIFTVGSGNPSQIQLTAGQLANTSQRLSVKFYMSKVGTTDQPVVLLYLGTLGTIADTTIGTTGLQAASTRTLDGEFIIQRVDATHILCTLRLYSASTTAATGSIVVPNLDTTALVLSLGLKTGTTDAPTLVDCQMEMR